VTEGVVRDWAGLLSLLVLFDKERGRGDDNRACRRSPEAGGGRLRQGWLAGHPRRRRCCYWEEFALLLWTAVVGWPGGGAPLTLLPLRLTLPLPLPLPLPNE